MCGAFCTKAEKANIETLSPNVLENIVKNTMDRKMKEWWSLLDNERSEFNLEYAEIQV